MFKKMTNINELVTNLNIETNESIRLSKTVKIL